MLFDKGGPLRITLSNLRYLVSYLLLEKLFVKLVFGVIVEAFLLLAELVEHLLVVQPNFSPLLKGLMPRGLPHALLRSNFFGFLIRKLSLEGAFRFRVRM